MTARASAFRWALLGALLHALLVLPFIVRYGGAEWFLHLDDGFTPALDLAHDVLGPDVVVPHEVGHDGRASWVLARDPLLLDGSETARLLDRPAYRSQRIAYPAIAAPWRLLGEKALLWGLVATNIVVAGVGTGLASLVATEVGAPGRASLAFTLAPPTIVATLGDLGDGLAVAALLATVLSLLRRSAVVAAASAAVAVLARDVTLLSVAALAVLAGPLRPRQRAVLLATPTALLVLWLAYSRWRLGWPQTSIDEIDLPFRGFVRSYRRLWAPEGAWLNAIVAVGSLGFAAATVLRWWRRRGSLLLQAALPHALLVPFLHANVLDILLNSTRALGPAFTLVALDAYSSRREGEARTDG